MRLPAILPLLLAGLLLGPAAGVLDPDELLGEMLFPFISLGVAIILFEGSLTLRFSDTRSVARIIRNLTSIGVLVPWGIMGSLAHYLAGLSWSLSLLFGALVSVTGPTVIVPMLRSIRPTARIANILRWEGILVDPIGAVLAVLLFEFLVKGHRSESIIEFIKVIATGTVWGVAGGAGLGYALKHHSFPDYLQNYASLAAVLLVFTGSNALGSESGLIAVTVMGVALANMKDVDVDELLSFKENLTIVLISVFFILLAARLDFDLVMQIGGPALMILAVALFVARPVSVLISSIGTSVNLREKALLSWIAPRGIVAAAVSSLFALKLERAGVPQAAEIVPLTFVMIIGTVVVQGLSSGWLAELLGLSSRAEQGVLITSANKVSLAIGEVLKKNSIQVKMVESRHQYLKEARMLGLEVFYGNPLSEYADRYMDLTGYTHLLAMSRNAEANTMICNRYRHYFGPLNVFSIQVDSRSGNRDELARGLKSRTPFDKGPSWSKLASCLGQGAVIKATSLTEEYDLETHRLKWGNDALLLFALDEKGKLKFFTSDDDVEAGDGWTLINLVIENGT